MKIQSIYQKIIERINRNGNLNAYMFHRVGNDAIDGYANISISIKHFEEFVERKLEFGTVGNLIMWMEDIKGNDHKSYFTFDDMFSDAYENAIPILRKRGLPYTVFISTGLLDTNGYISSAQLQELSKDPLCTIGAHSQSHLIMRALPKEEIVNETDKHCIENLIGHKIELFAYPYGSYYACNKKVREIVSRAGYRYAFSTVDASLDSKYAKSNLFFLPRININDRNFLKK